MGATAGAAYKYVDRHKEDPSKALAWKFGLYSYLILFLISLPFAYFVFLDEAGSFRVSLFQRFSAAF